MDIKRWKAYVKLINTLLTSNNSNQIEILQAHADLIDLGLVEAINNKIKEYRCQGNEETAQWLQNFSNQINISEKNISEKIKLQAEADRLYEKGNKQYEDGNFEDVIALWQQALNIYQRIKSYSKEAEIIGNLGRAYHDLENYNKAIECCEQSLSIVRVLQYRQVEGGLLNNIGFYLLALKKEVKAINYFKQSLPIARETGDHYLQMKSLKNLEIAYRSQNNEIKVNECCLQILDLEQELNNRNGEGFAYYELGKSYEALKNFSKATECYGQSLNIAREVEDRQLEGIALYHLGFVPQFLGNNSKAIEFYKQSLRISQEIQHRNLQLHNLYHLGFAYSDLGNRVQALEYLPEALTIAQETQDTELEMKVFNSLGLAYHHLGDFNLAVDYHQKSLVVARKRKDIKGEYNSLFNLGLSNHYIGNLGYAIKLYEQSLTIAKEIKEKGLESNNYNNLGNIYRALGNDLKALEYYEKSLTIDREIKNKKGEGKTLGNLGNIYRSFGYYEQAIDYHQQCLAIAQDRQDRQEEMSALNNLGLDYEKLPDYDTAIEYFQQDLALAKETKDRLGEAKALGSIGNIYYFLKEYDKAINYHQQSLLIAQAIGNKEEEGTTLNNIGVFLSKIGDFQLAEKNLLEAININESIRISLGNSDTNKISIFDKQINPYRYLQKVLVEQRRTEEALGIAEQGRARAFVDLLAERLSISSANQFNISPISIQQIQHLAQKNKVTLVEYSIFYDGLEEDPTIFIWVVSPTSKITFFQADTSYLKEQNISLTDLVEQTHKSISSSQTLIQNGNSDIIESLENQDYLSLKLQKLYQILIQPIVHLISQKTNIPLVFIPQDILFLVPFAALQDSEGKFLIEKQTIITAPSIQALDLINQNDNSRTITNSLIESIVVGNPKMPTIPLTDPPVELQDLAWAETEAKVISHFLKTKAFTGALAIKTDILPLLPQARIIHFATHGLLDDIRQLGIPGAIALSSSNNDDGFLTAGEIYDMKLNAELVILSACNTGRGKITGDGVVGLSRSLFAAGVKSVIVSLWSVEDLSTTLLMVKFYQIFRKGVSATIALNDAQRWLLGVTKEELKIWVKTNSRFFDATLKVNLLRRLHQLDDNIKLYRHPRYWAAFCAIGQ